MLPRKETQFWFDYLENMAISDSNSPNNYQIHGRILIKLARLTDFVPRFTDPRNIKLCYITYVTCNMEENRPKNI